MSTSIKKALMQGLADEAATLSAEAQKSANKNVKKPETNNIIQSALETVETKVERVKHPGGRPTLESKGKKKRKQYTLTLAPEFYETIMTFADFDGLSFSKYIERAVNEYMDNHK